MDIVQIAKDALKQKYGEKPKREVEVRFYEEVAQLRRHHAEMLFSVAYKKMQAFREENRVFYVQGVGAASFLAYLLGISRVNPLPAHYYCPICKKVVWGRRKYGYELPPWRKCDCGADMVGDGYNVAKEYFWNDIYRISEISFGFAGEKEVGMQSWCAHPFSDRLALWAFYYNSVTNRGEEYRPADCAVQMAARPFFFSYRDDIIDYLVRREVCFTDAYYIVMDHVRRGGARRMPPLLSCKGFSAAQTIELENTKYLYPKVHAIEVLLAVETLHETRNGRAFDV